MTHRWLGISISLQDECWDRRLPLCCYALSGWALALWLLRHWLYLPNWFSTLPSRMMSPVTLCIPVIFTQWPTLVLILFGIILNTVLLLNRVASRNWTGVRMLSVGLLALCLVALLWVFGDTIDDVSVQYAIGRYNFDVDDIERYSDDHGEYPPTLDVLVPRYLPKVPGIYMAYGEVLKYDPDSSWGYVGCGPFTFELYGHDMSGWHGMTLKYCPIEDNTCNSFGRIDGRWVWAYASAL